MINEQLTEKIVNHTANQDGDDITGIVLAGGRSQRMGQCKTTLKWAGQTLLAHQKRCFYALKIPCFVSGPMGINDLTGPGEQERKSTHQPGRAKDSGGPLVGIHSCLQRLPYAALIFIPIDMPCLTADLLRNVLNTAIDEKSNAQSPAIMYEGHPLPCLIRRTADNIATARQLLQAPGRRRSLQHYFGSIGCTHLPSGQFNDRLTAQANTPKQWRALQSREAKAMN